MKSYPKHEKSDWNRDSRPCKRHFMAINILLNQQTRGRPIQIAVLRSCQRQAPTISLLPRRLGGKNRLTGAIIKKLTLYYGLAIRRNVDSVEGMKKAIHWSAGCWDADSWDSLYS